MEKKVTIIGAGIGGLTLAIALKQKGIQGNIFESAHEIKPVGSGILMANNAMQIFKKLGIEKKIENAGHKVYIMSITEEKLKPLSTVDLSGYEAKFGVPTVAIHRAELQRILAEEVGNENIALSKRLAGIEQGDRIALRFEDNTTDYCNILLAADGIKSVVRNQLFNETEIRDTKQVCWRGVVEMELDKKYDHTIVEAWGKGKRFGFAKISTNKIYWFAVLNVELFREGEMAIENYFKEFHPDILKMISTTRQEDIIYTKITDLKPISKWYNKNICLLGDAAHASTPNMGQGACQAIEDAYTLGQLFTSNQPVEKVFQEYESLRIKRAQNIVNHSWELGKTGHIKSTVGVWLRNAYMYIWGKSFINKQLEQIFNIGYADK